jgi:hypothetical protein
MSATALAKHPSHTCGCSGCSEAQQLVWQRAIDEHIPGRRKYAEKLQALHTCLVALEGSGTTKEDVFR